jgi:hypothetical protein
MENEKVGTPGKDQRTAFKENAERATEKEPSEFRDDANEHKRVEIGKDLTENPIQGIDPKS